MIEKNELYAAVDLGSNSFHMIVAEIVNNQMHVIDRHKDMVRLANGLDEKGYLTGKKIDEAIASLEKIGQRIAHIPKSHLRIVGTNTLRKAKNAEAFLVKASAALGKPIDVISGREEARILYLGVAHSLASNQGKRLVIDIGGGSTELIIGQEFTPLLRESLHMGCVSYTKKFFPDGEISKKNWDKAIISARRQLLPIVSKYATEGWNIVIGASGSMRSTAKVIVDNNYSIQGIDSKGLKKLINRCFERGKISRLDKILGLSSRRQPVFIGGLAIIKALFDSLLINEIQCSIGALKEGIVYDLSGRLHHNDIRDRTIQKLVIQFEIDVSQSRRVYKSIELIKHISNIKLNESQEDLLEWVANLHELGLKISHSHFEKHAAYILINADMPGFSTQEQLKLAVLVSLQRRKINKEWLGKLSTQQYLKLLPLIIILRSSVLLNRPRVDVSLGLIEILINGNTVQVVFKQGWLKKHPLTHADLLAEVKFLKALDVDYQIKEIL